MLTRLEVSKIVNRYIGVSDGYLGDFSYRTHAEFYPEYCELHIDPNKYEGTTRERFIQIVTTATPDVQARILRGVLQKFPPENGSSRAVVADDIKAMIERLEGAPRVSSPSLRNASDIVQHAIADALTLIEHRSATSGVDRIHTALHGYLKSHCEQNSIPYPADASLTQMLKALRVSHPALNVLAGPRQQDIDTVLRSFATVVDALNPLRNKASVAHSNPALLQKDEALVVIHAVNTILHYLESKFRYPGPE